MIETEVPVKPQRRLIFLLLLVVSSAFLATAQDGSQSLGDIARQERARRMAQTDATEIAGIKEADFHANILFTDSKTADEKWVLMPAAEKPNAGRIRQVPPDREGTCPLS